MIKVGQVDNSSDVLYDWEDSGMKKGELHPIEPPFTSLMDMEVPFDFQTMAGSTIIRDLLDETRWSKQGKPSNHVKSSWGTL